MLWLPKTPDSQGLRTANQTRSAKDPDTEAKTGLISTCLDIWKRRLFDLGGGMDLCLFFCLYCYKSVYSHLSLPLTACLSLFLSVLQFFTQFSLFSLFSCFAHPYHLHFFFFNVSVYLKQSLCVCCTLIHVDISLYSTAVWGKWSSNSQTPSPHCQRVI